MGRMRNCPLDPCEEYVCERCKRYHYLNRLAGHVSMRVETLTEKLPSKRS
jgi:hypothetical protein